MKRQLYENSKCGDIFDFNGVKIKVTSCNLCMGCSRCYFYSCKMCHNVACTSSERADGKSVCFKKISKSVNR